MPNLAVKVCYIYIYGFNIYLALPDPLYDNWVNSVKFLMTKYHGNIDTIFFSSVFFSRNCGILILCSIVTVILPALKFKSCQAIVISASSIFAPPFDLFSFYKGSNSIRRSVENIISTVA